ncbi:hypothetical protein [Methylocapsa sp. S129]|uniref:hypothetical protein n=1 Tax=Methylocapsa sp. S129 TaxID=1641869 RepID=UPI00131B280C|nr:hypothetical protein [Methylocapsa sp. S129]
MRNAIYKGYLVKYYFTNQWIAKIYPPGSKVMMEGGIATATKDEGETILLARVHASVDEGEVKGSGSITLKADVQQPSANQEMPASNWDTAPAVGSQNDVARPAEITDARQPDD